MARSRRQATSLSDAEIDKLIPDERGGESEEWKRAFRYAYKKGNFYRESDIEMLERDPDVVRRGNLPRLGDPMKTCITYADSHAEDFEDGETPVVKQEA